MLRGRDRLALLMLALAAITARPLHAQNAPHPKQDNVDSNGASLASARKLFAEALRDEEKGRFAEALEKFRRVMQVKDTVPVRYRIGACLEGLGKLKEAQAAYQSVVDLGSRGAKDLEVVREAKAQMGELSARIPLLTLNLPERIPPGAEVRVDGSAIAPEAIGKPIALDPGTHEVSATAPSSSPFHTQITLAERARLSLLVALQPKPLEPKVEPPLGASSPEAPPSSSRATAGWISAGVGAAFLVGAGVTLALRASDISTLEDACQNGCPREREQELLSIRSRAQAEGPIAAVLAGVGIVGVGVGAYLLLTNPKAPSTKGAVHVVPAGGQLLLRTTF